MQNDGTLGYGDGRKPQVGEKIVVNGPPVLCHHGLHGARDALFHASGSIISRVVISGEIILGDDKLVGTERTILWQADAANVLDEFRRWCALSVVHLWDAPDVAIEFLKTGDEEIRAAAFRTAEIAARAAVMAVDRVAVRAAWAAAWDAALAEADWAAIKEEQNMHLESLLYSLAPK